MNLPRCVLIYFLPPYTNMLFLRSEFLIPARFTSRKRAPLSFSANDKQDQGAACYSWQLSCEQAQHLEEPAKTGVGEEGLPPTGSSHLLPAAACCSVPGADSFVCKAQVGWALDEHNIGHGVFTHYGKTKERQQMQCQNEKTLQFQLHTCKPSIRIDPARCFPIIIHFLLLTSLNKYNSPNQILTISPVLNLMNFLSFMPFSQYAT